MPNNPIATWFRPKTFGFGWSPATWEGWAVTAAVVAVIVATGRAIA